MHAINKPLSPQQIAEKLISDPSQEERDKSLVKKTAKKDPKLQSPPIVEKFWYDIRVECHLPATLTYRVLAEDAVQAAGLIKNMSPVGVKHKLAGKKDIKLSVYRAGSSMLEWVKNLLGG